MIICFYNHKGGIGKTTLSAHTLFRGDYHGIDCLGVAVDEQADLLYWIAGSSQVDAKMPVRNGRITGLFSPMQMPPKQLLERYPLVVIDAPPAKSVPDWVKPDLWVVPIDNVTAIVTLSRQLAKMTSIAPSYIVLYGADEGGDVTLRSLDAAVRGFPELEHHDEVITRGGSAHRGGARFQPMWKVARDANTKVSKQVMTLCDKVLHRVGFLLKGPKGGS
jgi:hypothetical protein